MTVDAVLPDGIDDPARPSGGNVYDRHVCNELVALGWSVREHSVPGFWTQPDTASFAALAAALERIPAEAVVLIDGLIASRAPEVLLPQARRLRLVVLVHMPLGDRPQDAASRRRERDVLSAAAAIVTTSGWARRRLLALYPLPTDRVHVARPGVDAAEIVPGTPSGEALLCVGAVTRDKGHELLLDALVAISDLSWHCVCVGRLDRDPAFVDGLRRRAAASGLADRLQFRGPLTGPDLDRSYAAADLTVLASRAETYGMVVTEALARGLPVVAANVGGVTEALGHGAGGRRPGVLIAPDDATALASALRAWLGDAGLRRQLRQAARERRESLPSWSTTAVGVAAVLSGASG